MGERGREISSRQRHQHFRFRLFMLKEVWRAWQNVDGITDNNNNSATLVPFTNSPHLPLLLSSLTATRCAVRRLGCHLFLVALIAHLSCRGMNFFSSAHTDMLSIIQINRRRRKYDMCRGASINNKELRN